MQEVPRQRSPAAVARPGLQPRELLALHRSARGHGRLVVDQPAIQADQDRRPRRASRPRHHLPAGRSRRHGSDGAGHPCRHLQPSSAPVMRMTAIHAQTERQRQDRSARCAEKHRCRAQNTAASRSDPPCSNSLRDQRRRLGRKMLAQRAKSGVLHVSQNATWGMLAFYFDQASMTKAT